LNIEVDADLTQIGTEFCSRVFLVLLMKSFRLAGSADGATGIHWLMIKFYN